MKTLLSITALGALLTALPVSAAMSPFIELYICSEYPSACLLAYGEQPTEDESFETVEVEDDISIIEIDISPDLLDTDGENNPKS